MKTELRSITPELASKMLEKNFQNRTLNKKHIAYLSSQMKNNQWQFDGQPIRFDKYDRLLDGQHRLSAVVHSEETVQFLIVSGLEESTFKVMDTGKNRSSGDVLSTMGVKYSSDVAAVAKKVIAFERGVFAKSERIANTDVVSWYDDNKKITDTIRRADSFRSAFSGVLSRTDISLFLYLFDKKNTVVSEDFFDKLCMGIGLDVESPIFLLRKRLIEDKMAKAKLPQREKFALICKAWNFHRLDKNPKFLRWNKKTEKFPNLI